MHAQTGDIQGLSIVFHQKAHFRLNSPVLHDRAQTLLNVEIFLSGVGGDK